MKTGLIISIALTTIACAVPNRYTDFKGYRVVYMEPKALHEECNKIRPVKPGMTCKGFARWNMRDRRDCTIYLPPYYSQSLKDHEIAHCEGTIKDWE